MAMTQPFDEAKAEGFADRMLGALNGAGVTFLTSVAYRTGLLETLATLPPSTSEEIARAAGLQERYVRECLSGLVVGKVVHYDPAFGTFSLPPEHGAFLTKPAGPGNLALFAQLLPLIGTVEDELVECFRNGGGVPYSSYRRFAQVMAETYVIYCRHEGDVLIRGFFMDGATKRRPGRNQADFASSPS